MNENYQSPAVPSPSVAPTPPPPLVTPLPFSKKTWWLVMALVVVVVLAGVYYFYSPGESPSPYNMVVKPNPKPVMPDETTVLENDLQAVPLNDLDSELKDIKVELGK